MTRAAGSQILKKEEETDENKTLLRSHLLLQLMKTNTESLAPCFLMRKNKNNLEVTDTEAEIATLYTNAKNWLLEKDPDAER